MNGCTPGPWQATIDSHMVPQVIAGPITIAKVYLPPVGNAFDNARLIAAALDLLTALETMVKRIEFYSSMGESAQPNIEQWEYTEGSTDMANARVAIAKAKGTV